MKVRKCDGQARDPHGKSGLQLWAARMQAVLVPEQ